MLRQKGLERRVGDIAVTFLFTTLLWALMFGHTEVYSYFHQHGKQSRNSTDRQSRNVDKEDHSSPVQYLETLSGIHAFLKCRNELTRQTKGKEGDGIMAAHGRALCLITPEEFRLST